MTMDDSVRFVRDPAALSRETLPGTIVLGRGPDEFLLLEPPGDRVWAEIIEPISVGELVARLAVAFDAPIDVVRGDVSRFLDDLVGRGLAVEVPAQDPGARDLGP